MLVEILVQSDYTKIISWKNFSQSSKIDYKFSRFDISIRR